jgi:hypothetical protein
MKLMFCLAVGLAVAAAPAYAQGCSHSSSPSDAQEEREIIAPTFYSSDPANQVERGNVIEQLSSNAPSYVVRDDAVCTRALQRATRFMREHDPVWTSGREGNYSADVFRFGPYLVVSIMAEQPPVRATPSSVEIPPSRGEGYRIVYRAHGLKLLRVFN